ncbi:hypothetical protein GCM10027288_24540 [Bordetella tumbae]
MLFGAPKAYAFDCPISPAAVKNIEMPSIYIDKRGSIADPKKKAANDEARAPINKFLQDIQDVADEYYDNPTPDKLECGKNYLDSWAKARALLDGSVSGPGELVRFWATGAIGVAVLKLGLDEKTTPPAVRDWLQALGKNVNDYVIQRESKSNLYYWSGYSLGVMGLVLENKAYQDKSLEIFHESLLAIQPDGTLPIELRRGQRAAIYHAFAAQAIFGLAVLHNANFSELENGSFGKLVGLLKKTAANPRYLEEKVGVKQMRISKPSWLPIYDRLRAGDTSFSARRSRECIDALRLGGDICNWAALRQGKTTAKK